MVLVSQIQEQNLKTESLGVCRKHLHSAFYKPRAGYGTLNIEITA